MSTTESVTISVYKNEVERYLNEVERNSNQEDVAGVQHLRAAVNLMTLKTFDISPSQKLLIAELAVQNNFGNSIKTRIVFNLFGERIFRCRIFVFKDSFTGYDYEKAIHIMLHEGDRKQLQYTGQVDIYSTSKKLELRGTLQNGKLIKVAVATIIKNKIKNTARSNGCIDYYLVTSQGNTVVSVVFLYTLCEANTGDFVGGGGGGGGDGSYSLGSYLVLPVNPQQNAVHTHKDIDGTTITYKFIDNIWKIVQVVLPDLVLKSGRESNYGFLNFEFPEHDQMVMGYDGLSYRYNSFTGNWTGNEVVLEEDPCTIASNITKDALSSTFISAKSNIENASLDGLEHSITLGRDTSGNITQSSIRTGGQNAVAVNTSWSGAFASLHNHPNNTQLSAGDIYSSIKLNTMNSNFTTSYILTNGQLYSIVVTDLAAAQAFATAYPADQILGYNPEFPDKIFEEIEKIQTSDMKYTSVEGKTQAISFVLDKFNSGITLMKQDSTGDFKPIKMEEIILNGNTVYNQIHCN